MNQLIYARKNQNETDSFRWNSKGALFTIDPIDDT